MKWSWRLGKIAGIDVFVHWTFLLLLGWIFLSHLHHPNDIALALQGVGFVLALFGCVVLHELGHALTARRFGIPTKDITLLPIGGVARLERMPEEPSRELQVAIAGPAVNVVIAIGLFVVVNLWVGLSPLTNVVLVGGHLMVKLMWINLVLAGFNLVPAFPMDGGRVLRALLATRVAYARATQIAATVGQTVAIALGILGFFYNWFLLFIAMFVYVAAQEESHLAQVKSVLRGVPVRDAMMTRFRTLSRDDPLGMAVDELLSSAQQDFPVLEDDRIVGVLTRRDMLKAMSETNRDVPIGQVLQKDCGAVEETEMLENAFNRMHENGCSSLPVVKAGRLVGVLTLESVGEWMMIHSPLGRAGPRGEIEDVLHVVPRS